MSAIGIDQATGAFRTSAHKECPRTSRKGISTAVLRAVDTAFRQGRTRIVIDADPDTAVEEWLGEILQAGSAVRNVSWLPDFQGGR